MCGIAGFITPNESVAGREELLDAMCRVIAHRGPDDQGTILKGRAALGMRRLAIIDVTSGQQPICSEEGHLTIVFNGEIYNFRQLRSTLESKGYRFNTNSDTETILYAYSEYGENCVDHLRGMFAFAIWNSVTEELFMARDRVGKKPLFYSTLDDGTFVFGSELKSVMLYPGLSRETDLASIDSYLAFGYIPEHRCIFAAVKKLKPGHTLRFQQGTATTRRYWRFPYEPDEECDERAIQNELLEKLRDAVNVRLISEVPLGAFLSGGVDSSAVVGLMSQLSDEPVKTFSIGFKEDRFNELKYARIAASHFKTDHHEFVVTPDLVGIVDEIAWHLDEPFADPSSLPTYMLAKLAREHVTVVLSGDGGDELFGGYDRYKRSLSREWSGAIPRVGKNFLKWLSTTAPHRTWGKNYAFNISLDRTARYIDLISHFNVNQRSSLYSDEMLDRLNGSIGDAERDFEDIVNGSMQNDPQAAMLFLDSVTYLPSDIMVKVDRMTMANSVEARSPLLDQNVIELAGRIPSRLKINRGESKYVFKKALEKMIPREILYRKKQGFGVPISEWINTELKVRMRETLLDGAAISRIYLRPSHIELLLKENAEGRRDNSFAIWALFMLELWHQKFASP